MPRAKMYEPKIMPVAHAKSAYDAIDSLQGSVWDELVAVRDAAQAVLSRINEAKAHAMSDYVASQKASIDAKREVTP